MTWKRTLIWHGLYAAKEELIGLIWSWKRKSFVIISFLLFLADASSSNEAAHLQQKLKSLSTELVTLRSRLHPEPYQDEPEPILPILGRKDEIVNNNNNNINNNNNAKSHNYMNQPVNPYPYPNKPLPPQPSSSTLNSGSGSSNQGYYENQNFQKGEKLCMWNEIEIQVEAGSLECSNSSNLTSAWELPEALEPVKGEGPE